jgi:N-carbamoylputrescine amidase
MKDIKVAAVCMNSLPREINRNLDRIESFVLEASEKEVDIICFPELSITGYVLSDSLNVCPKSRVREIIERVSGMAEAKDLIIIAGMIEMADEGKPYISQIVAGPDGLLGIYRKTHLSPPERESYQAGHSIGIFNYEDIIFGVQLCYESHFPEISTVMALKGAEILFLPHASPRGSPDEKIESWLRHLTARAFDNALFVAACNQVGDSQEGFSFPGVAVVLNPAGRVIAQYDENEENMVLAELTLDEIRDIRAHRMKYFIPNRRPELYKELSSPISAS